MQLIVLHENPTMYSADYFERELRLVAEGNNSAEAEIARQYLEKIGGTAAGVRVATCACPA